MELVEHESGRGGIRRGDPMVRGRREVALEPVRVVVELRQEEFQALSEASGRVAPADYLRLVALRLAEAGERVPTT